MITIWEYYKRHKISTNYIIDLLAAECRNPYEPIRAFGKEIPQTLTTALKRCNAKAIKHINEQLRKQQAQERSRMNGSYYTKRRYATRPLHQCVQTLKGVEIMFNAAEKWATETDEAGLPIKKTLTYRHPYHHELLRLMSMAYLVDPQQAEPKA